MMTNRTTEAMERALANLAAAGIEFVEVTRCPVADCADCSGSRLPTAV